MARQIDGLALGVVAAGSLFAYAGVKGYSVPHALQALVSGKAPSTGGQANPIGTPAPAASGSTGGGGNAGNAAAGASEQSFFTAMLKDLGAPATAANLQSCYSWARHEEPGFPPQNVGGFAWNPLNIERVGGGGFMTYPSPSAGASATASFLLGNGYTAIVAAFRSGKGLCGNSSVSADLLRWSGNGYSSVC